jgi:hypothetical protein
MSRVWILLAFVATIGCRGSECLRDSSCPGDLVCRMGRCELPAKDTETTGGTSGTTDATGSDTGTASGSDTSSDSGAATAGSTGTASTGPGTGTGTGGSDTGTTGVPISWR